MKNTTKSIAALLLALALMISFCSCGIVGNFGKGESSGSQAGGQTLVRRALAGEYALFGVGQNGYVIDVSTMDISSVLTLEKDGTGYLKINDQGGDVEEWTSDGEKITIKSGVSVIEGEVNAGILVLDFDEGNIMYYAKDGTDTSSVKMISRDEYVGIVGGQSESSQESEGGTGGGQNSSEDKAAQFVEEGVGYLFGYGPGGYDWDMAWNAFSKAAQLGSGDGYFWLGRASERTSDPDRYERAIGYYDKAVELGCASGLVSKGILCMKGLGTQMDYAKAMELYRQAVDQGCDGGYVGLGELYRYGYGVEADGQKALDYYLSAVDSPDYGWRNMARMNVGMLYRSGGAGLEKDYAKAMEWYKRSIDENYPAAFNNTATLYNQGQGVEKDAAKAIEYFTIAYEHGNSTAARNLFYAYHEGDGVAQDLAKAFEYALVSAERGDAAGQSYLAQLYLNGEGTEKAPDEAIRWFKASAAGGYAYSMEWLGFIYYQGKVAEKDDALALEWLQKAIEYSDGDEEVVEYCSGLIDEITTSGGAGQGGK